MDNNKPEKMRKLLLILAVIGVAAVSGVYLLMGADNKELSANAIVSIDKDKDKCRYVGKTVLTLTQKEGSDIYSKDSSDIAKIIASGFKNAENVSNMIREKGKFTAFVLKDGDCSLEKKNCSLNVGMTSPVGECVFYLDEESGIQPSMSTAEFIKEETAQ